MADVPRPADAPTAGRHDARAVRLVALRHRVVPGRTPLLATVGPVELGLLPFARTQAHGPGRVAEAGPVEILVVRGTSEARPRHRTVVPYGNVLCRVSRFREIRQVVRVVDGREPIISRVGRLSSSRVGASSDTTPCPSSRSDTSWIGRPCRRTPGSTGTFLLICHKSRHCYIPSANAPQLLKWACRSGPSQTDKFVPCRRRRRPSRGRTYNSRTGCRGRPSLFALAVAITIIERVAPEAPRAFGQAVDLAHRLPGARLLRRCQG